jgi:hypothetical protein
VQGCLLSSPVPAELDPYDSHVWAESQDDIPRIALSQWLVNHRHWIGDATISLFQRARAEVVKEVLVPSVRAVRRASDDVFAQPGLVGLIAEY